MNLRKFLMPLVMLAAFLFSTGASPAEERFVDHGDGTVSDRQMGLMWAKTDNQGDIDWKSATRWARFTFPMTLPEGKREGWRLPTLEELQTLYVADESYEGYEADCGQHVRSVPEIELSCGWVWSSEKRRISSRVFNFQRGYHYTDRMIHQRGYRALPVRDLGPGEL